MKKYTMVFVIAGIFLASCGTSKSTVATTNGQQEEPVRIANDSLEYEIIIIDPGFTTYLNSIAKPMEYYSQSFMESRNIIYVTEWNNRYRNPQRYNSNIYENEIDYRAGIDYGLEVNYKLFWYFQFAQRKYNMQLSGFRVYQ